MTDSADGSVDLRLVLMERLDREVEDTYQLTVIALDGGDPPRSGSMAVQVQVTDANDNSPTFTESSYEVIFSLQLILSFFSISNNRLF